VAINIGAALATSFTALSGSQHKAPGFAGGYLLKNTLILSGNVCLKNKAKYLCRLSVERNFSESESSFLLKSPSKSTR